MAHSQILMRFTQSSLLEYAAQHSERVFIVIHERVYDVTSFLKEVKLLY